MTNGIISSINKKQITVTVQCESACTQCPQHETCRIESLKKTVVIKEKAPQEYHLGEEVTLELAHSTTMFCVVLAYGIPLILVLIILILGDVLKFSETTAGIVALLSLIPYYAILYFSNFKLKKHIQIKMTKKSVD